MENQNPRVLILWEHSLTNLLGHDSTSDPGIALRQWVLVEYWGLPPLIPLLQCVNRLGFEICSVNSCQSEQGSLVTLI